MKIEWKNEKIKSESNVQYVQQIYKRQTLRQDQM